MPTPVSVARQCLTEEAARALDDAVAVARRRNHGQTNSLHAVSALMSLPSSPLREACTRARSSAYSPRLQFKALELSVSVSLDRLPCTKNLGDPPLSNSLMAAIKRSQANQRRSPESFHLHQIHSAQQTTPPAVKVELKHFLASILDDPIVSRVLGEAGFRSYDIKLAIARPPAPAPAPGHFKSACPPPVFLCNLGGEDGDENCGRIGEVLARKSGKNPLIIGVCSNSALQSFLDGVDSGKRGVLPAGVGRLSSIRIEKEISEFVRGEGKMARKFKELGDVLQRSSGSGVIVSLGLLTALICNHSSSQLQEAAGYVVSQLAELLRAHRERLWLIGAVENYETYLKLLSWFPTVEKDWDLHLLPITYRSSSSNQSFSPSKSSLMGSFVPFGGFFSIPSDFATPMSSPCSASRCDLCNKQCAEEVAALLRDGSSTSLSDQSSTNLPSWLQMAEADANKTEDDRTTLNTKILEQQKKWNKVCRHLHKPQPVEHNGIPQAQSQIAAMDSFRLVADDRERCADGSSVSENRMAQVGASIVIDLPKISPWEKEARAQPASQAERANMQNASATKHDVVESPWKFPVDQSCPQSAPSVTTDLGLGMINAPSSESPETWRVRDYKECTQKLLGSASSSLFGARLKTSPEVGQRSSLFWGHDHLSMQSNPHDFKTLQSTLQKKVGWQDEALRIISEVVSRYKSSRTGKDLWLAFLGPDRVGKRRIASALAEIIFNDRKRLVYADLSYQEEVSPANSIFELQEFQACEMNLRGKTTVDFIADELRQKPHSVVYLENVERADVLMQNCLSQAISTGKLKDTYGREVKTSNTIFVTSSTTAMDREISPSNMPSGDYSELRVLGASKWQMQISVECAAENAGSSTGVNVVVMSKKSPSAMKRKYGETSDSSEQDRAMGIWKRVDKMKKSFLDLNLPVEDVEEELDNGDSDTDLNSEDSEAWLKEFLERVDENVVFKPYDFKEAAEGVVEEIRNSMQSAVGSAVTLKIDEEVVVQMVAAGWLCGEQGAVKEWIREVLRRGFVEAHQRHKLTAYSTVKLTVCEGMVAELQASGVCLPASINLKQARFGP